MMFPSRKSRRVTSSNPRAAKPRIVQLEDRLTPAGFGPEDGAYIIETRVGSYRDVKIQPADQKVVAAGTSNSAVLISRYDSQGQIDTAYGSGGSSNPSLGAGIEGFPDLVLQADGKAVLGFSVYSVTSPSLHGVARFKSNGALDNTFGFGATGWNTVDVRPDDSGAFTTAVALQSTGKIVIASHSYVTSGNPALVARFTTAGKLNSGNGGFGTISQGNKTLGYSFSTFGGDTNFFADAVVQPDDKIVAVGSSRNVPGFVVARFTANGVLDTSSNGTGFGFFLPGVAEYTVGQAIARQADGKLVVVGRCAGIDGSGDLLVARLNSNLTLDTSFGGGAGYVQLDVDGIASQTMENAQDVVIQPDGKIVVSSNAYDPSIGLDSTSRLFLSRFNSDGTADATFGSGGMKFGSAPAGHYFIGHSLALQLDGDIIVAGNDNDGTNSHPLLMRFFGGTPLSAAGAPSSINSHVITNSQVQPLLTEALTRWQTAGVNVSALQGVNLRIADLGGSTLGLASGNTIWLDDNAAGHGWFVDRTPGNDSEFTTRGNQGEQNRIDLLTTLMHEVGHLLGHDHEASGVMQESLGVSQRLTLHGVYVGDADVDVAFPAWRDHSAGRRAVGRLRR